MNILLAEDDLRLGKLIVHMLEKKGDYKVDWVTVGSEVKDYVASFHYDFIILDWMLPELSGVEACRELRKKGYTVAIIMLTARDGLIDRVEGLDAGADDYLVKPFEFEELFARLRALSRRSNTPIKEEIIRVKDLLLNRTDHTVKYKNNDIQLTPREFQLLDIMVQNKGQVLTREVMLDRIWGHDAVVTKNAIDAAIKLLRKKIDLPDETTLIQSVRGVGYRFEG